MIVVGCGALYAAQIEDSGFDKARCLLRHRDKAEVSRRRGEQTNVLIVDGTGWRANIAMNRPILKDWLN